MARQVSTFTIGLFVTFGIIIGVSAVVWVGASRYFEKGTLYVTYFDESVQGLQKDSVVKYRGVDAGRIVSIGVAPDNRLITVVMKIDLTDDLEKNTVAQLKAVGLTGIVFIELDRRDPRAADIAPRLNFPSKYPVIPSRPSEIRQILVGIDSVIDKLNKVDFQGISDQFKTTAKSADTFLAGDRMTRIMANLESSTAALDKSVTGVERIVSRGDLENTMTEARQTLADTRALLSGFKTEVVAKLSKVDFQGVSEQFKATAKSADTFLAGDRMTRIMANLESSTTALDKSVTQLEKIVSGGALAGTLTEAKLFLTESRALISGLRGELKTMRLADTGAKAHQVADAWARSSRDTTVNMQRATENLKSASENLERLIERLEAHPSDLLFGD